MEHERDDPSDDPACYVNWDHNPAYSVHIPRQRFTDQHPDDLAEPDDRSRVNDAKVKECTKSRYFHLLAF